jgi:Gas vesicle synthesis protein GvpL/GvpF
MIYVYAITDPLRLAAGATGLDDTPLEELEAGGVCGVHSTHAQLEYAPQPPLLWRHERVVEQLMDVAGVLPLRFGTVLEDVEDLRSILSREGPRFQRLLQRVRGRVELAVRVGLPPTSRAPAIDGADYMKGKLAAQREREGAVDRILGPLRELAIDTSQRKSLGSEAGVSESYLVAREAVEPFVARVRLLQARNETIPVSCTGPWGPYSFVDQVAV